MKTSWSFLLIGYNIICEISSFLEKRVNLVSSNKRSSHPEVFSGKGVLKIFSKTTSMQKRKIYTHAKFTAEHSCRSTISIKLQSMGLQHGCSSVTFLHILERIFLRMLLEDYFWNGKYVTQFARAWFENVPLMPLNLECVSY